MPSIKAIVAPETPGIESEIPIKRPYNGIKRFFFFINTSIQ
jgi:hypothetical protein